MLMSLCRVHRQLLLLQQRADSNSAPKPSAQETGVILDSVKFGFAILCHSAQNQLSRTYFARRKRCGENEKRKNADAEYRIQFDWL